MTEETKEFLKEKTRKYGTIGSFSIVSLLLLFQTFQDLFSNEDVKTILKENCQKIEQLEKKHIMMETTLKIQLTNINEKLTSLKSDLQFLKEK